MSLDVSLVRKKWISYDEGKSHEVELEELYTSNITHNLGEMATKAGIYEALWRPYRLKEGYNAEPSSKEEYEFENNTTVLAKEIAPVIEKGLKDLIKRPKYFEKFNASNGWGLYIHFVPFVREYLEACNEYPEAIVKVSR